MTAKLGSCSIAATISAVEASGSSHRPRIRRTVPSKTGNSASVSMAPFSRASTRGSMASRQAPQSVAIVRRASMAPTPSEGPEAYLTRGRSPSYERLRPAPRAGLQPRVVRPAAVGGIDVQSRRDDLVDPVEDVVAERHVRRGELGLQVLHRPRADDRRRHRGMADDEGERHLDERDARLLGQDRQLLDGIHLALVLRHGHVEAQRDGVHAAAVHLLAALAVATGQEAAGERAPRDHAHAVALAHREHLSLDPADEQRVRRLLGHEADLAAALGAPVRLDDLGPLDRRAADVDDLALADEVAEDAERLVDVGVRPGAMDLVEVDPAGLPPPEAVLDLARDPAPRVALLVGVVAHRAVDLRREDHVVPALPERLADDHLRLTA